jgi:DNA excision repair protein ERCC-2
MARCIEAIPGNAIAYFSSFQMLNDIASRWVLPDHEVWIQHPSMGEKKRRDWLDQLGRTRNRVVLGAVLGGIFAEGIDPAPGALSGVLVCGPALPPVSLERDLLREHFEARYGAGFRYASLIPGLTRVAQAAGRLLRRPEDRGAVVLFDRRFGWREYAALLPDEWEVDIPDDPIAALAEFWGSQNGPGGTG